MKLLRAGFRGEVFLQTACASKTPLGLVLEVKGMPSKFDVEQSTSALDGDFSGTTHVEVKAVCEEYSGDYPKAFDGDSILFVGETEEENAALAGAMFLPNPEASWGGPPAMRILLMPKSVLETERGDLGRYPRDAQILKTLGGRARDPIFRMLLNAIGVSQTNVEPSPIRLTQYCGELPNNLRERLEHSGFGTMEVSRMPAGALMVTFSSRLKRAAQPVELEGAPLGDAAFLFDNRLIAVTAQNPRDRELLKGSFLHYCDSQLRYSYLYSPKDLFAQAAVLAKLD